MLKNLVRSVTVLGLLVAGHVAYSHVFAIVSSGTFRARGVPLLPPGSSLSRTAIETTELAKTAFGPGHWSTTAKLRYYDAARGYWIFASKFDRHGDGKEWDFTPVAVILRNKEGAMRTIVGKRATVEFSRPFDIAKAGSEPTTVTRAKISEDVQLRDDRGTPADINDDLLIGPMDYVVFDDRTQQITSESRVELRDRTLVASGIGLQIDLLERTEGAGRAGYVGGYEGVRSIQVMRDINIHVQDVGRSGVVPGTTRAADREGQAKQPPRPGELKCDGPMRIDVAPKRQAPEVGPPPPPTTVNFSRNVRLKQDSEGEPDQLDCDNLYITLVPDPDSASRKPAEPGDPPKTHGPMDGYVMQYAKATGHAVFLRSPSQGLDARGREMIFDRLSRQRSRIYLWDNRQTLVKKSNYEMKDGRRGPLLSVDTIETVDVTVFQENEGSTASIVARGPGRLETRSAKTPQLLERTASWKDKLIVYPVEAEATKDQPRRKITLLGEPTIESVNQGRITAKNEIVAMLRPKEFTVLPAGGPNQHDSSSYTIEWMTAKTDVYMNSQDNAKSAAGAAGDGPKTLHARDKLDIVFVELPAGTHGFVAPTPPAQESPPATDAPAPNTAAAAAARPAQKPANPAVRIDAGYVWASVGTESAANANSSFEIQEVRLRDNVDVHQDPRPNQSRGFDAIADELDLRFLADGLAVVNARGTPDKPAHVTSEDTEIEGPVLRLDQSRDYAAVDGAGFLKSQRAGRTLTAQKPAENAMAPAIAVPTGEPAPKSPFTIHWTKGMELFGRHPQASGRAKAFFYANPNTAVVAKTTDGTLAAEELEILFDQPISLAGKLKQDSLETPNADPEIVEATCQRAVQIEGFKFDPRSQAMVERREVSGPWAHYVRKTGDFTVRGEGVVRIYRVGGAKPQGDLVDANRSVKPIANNRQDGAKKPSSIELTQVQFRKEMKGRFDAIAADAEPGKPPHGKVTFTGDVQSMLAEVPDWQSHLDPDRPPNAFQLLSARRLDIISDPTTQATRGTDRILVDATEDPIAFDESKSLKGDRITYDSLNGLFYVYGYENEVVISEQAGAGLPFTSARGTAVRYDTKSKRSALIDPKTSQIIDPTTGSRARVGQPEKPPAEEKDKPRPLRPIRRSDKERRGIGQ